MRLFIIACCVMVVNNPFILSALMCEFIILICYQLCGIRKYLRAILLLVYLGGVMILVRYCVMILPSYKFNIKISLFVARIIAFTWVQHASNNVSTPYGLLYRASAIFLVAILLFLVLLAVVDIIDYSCGILKF